MNNNLCNKNILSQRRGPLSCSLIELGGHGPLQKKAKPIDQVDLIVTWEVS